MSLPYHFIIADDEADMLYLLTRVVARAYPSATITAVDNGQDALTAFGQTGADMLIVDYVMPGMDGITLVRILRSRNITTPVIVISSTDKAGPHAIAAGATLFLEKSVALQQLPQAIANILP